LVCPYIHLLAKTFRPPIINCELLTRPLPLLLSLQTCEELIQTASDINPTDDVTLVCEQSGTGPNTPEQLLVDFFVCHKPVVHFLYIYIYMAVDLWQNIGLLRIYVNNNMVEFEKIY
jgi:hypothetical protein